MEMQKDQLIVVGGGGGFIGGSLVAQLLQRGFTNIRSVDIKPFEEWDQRFDDVENLQLETWAAWASSRTTRPCACCRCSSRRTCCWPPATPAPSGSSTRPRPASTIRRSRRARTSSGYGWEKLFTERMCRHFREDFDLTTRVARFHNVYGPNGTWEGGREKAPAALCRKVIHAKATGSNDIEIWGDGKQTRSFMYIDDCLEGVDRLINSDVMVTINQLLDIVEEIGGVKLNRNYKLDAPKGVNGRNSDNTLIQKLLGWEPSIRLRDGMAKTYAWIHDEYMAKYGAQVVES
jgi:nucleoside-diphosphate-sugar epimerase